MMDDLAAALASLAQARDTNSRLHRRCQEAEGNADRRAARWRRKMTVALSNDRAARDELRRVRLESGNKLRAMSAELAYLNAIDSGDVGK